jgi:hypothetical protein
MGKKILWALVILILPILTFQNCGQQGLGTKDFSDLEKMGDTVMPGVRVRPPNTTIRPPKSTDTGNPNPNHPDAFLALMHLCNQMETCGMIPDGRSCSDSKLSTIEFIRILSDYPFTSYDHYRQFLDEPERLYFDSERNYECYQQYEQVFPSCSRIGELAADVQFTKTGSRDPLNFNPDWVLDLYKNLTTCNQIIWVYLD